MPPCQFNVSIRSRVNLFTRQFTCIHVPAVRYPFSDGVRADLHNGLRHRGDHLLGPDAHLPVHPHPAVPSQPDGHAERADVHVLPADDHHGHAGEKQAPAPPISVCENHCIFI